MNEAGLNLIKSFEGCKLTSYYDSVGVITIGFGHTGSDVEEDMTITQDQADALLASDLKKFEDGVNSLVTTDISENQHAALVSFAYNLGLHSLSTSTLLKLVNEDNFDDAAPQFLRWNRAGGQVLAGLTRRRETEMELFKKEQTC